MAIEERSMRVLRVVTAAVMLFGVSAFAQQRIGRGGSAGDFENSLSGLIADAAGHPIPDTFVSLLTRRSTPYDGDRFGFDGRIHVQSNAAGRYEFNNIAPGEYVVVAIPHNPPVVGGRPNPAGFRTTYSPGAATAALATPVKVEFRKATTADVTMTPAKLAVVGGVVLGDDEKPVPGGRVSIGHGDGLFGLDSFSASIRNDGVFLLAGLPPGTYFLSYTNYAGRFSSAANYKVSHAEVHIDGRDISGVRVAPVRRVHAAGRLVLDEETLKAFKISDIKVGMSPVSFEGTPGPQGPTVLHDDFTFESDVWPTRMRPRVLIGGEEVRLTALRLNGADVLKEGIDFSPGRAVTGIEVTASMKNRIR
jgi:hypothetical protein